ncbi:hypothetical protein BH18ACT17_BH18ACT17_04420 [soil metagenome]
MNRSDRFPRRLAAAVVVLSTLVASLGSVAAAATPPRGRFGVGDSIMLSARDELRAFGFGVNAVVGRQFGSGVWIVRHKAADGTLTKRVIVHLGTNGTIDPRDCDRLVEHAGPRRRVFLTTIKVPRSWERPNNDTLNRCASRHDKVHLIRWWARSHDHPEWFAGDGYHLNSEGQQAYARFVDKKVDEVLSELRAGSAR